MDGRKEREEGGAGGGAGFWCSCTMCTMQHIYIGLPAASCSQLILSPLGTCILGEGSGGLIGWLVDAVTRRKRSGLVLAKHSLCRAF